MLLAVIPKRRKMDASGEDPTHQLACSYKRGHLAARNIYLLSLLLILRTICFRSSPSLVVVNEARAPGKPKFTKTYI
jgi:hypothetical protein